MSYAEFCRLDPEEFSHIYRAFCDQAGALYRDNWERMRMLASIVIQPHVKNRLTPRGLIPFPWDKETAKGKPEVETKEEARERFTSLMKRLKKLE